jgi:N-acetylglutamate synthase-like GNAT family acetyltransferase
MVVFPAYRGRGIARLLIEWLIAESGLPTLYCLPFEDLAELYRSCGFALHEAASVPDKLRAKYTWCNNHYARRVLLMARQSATSS